MNGVEREIGGGKEGAIGLTGADNDRAASRGLRWDHALIREREGERELGLFCLLYDHVAIGRC